MVVAVVLLASACSGAGASDDSAPAPTPTLGTLAPTPPPTPPPTSNAAGSETCDEVVAGINAFNEGDYDETVSHFERALPLAEAAAADGSVDAGLLLEAVQYYATLPAGDYLDASQSSPDFARWKAVTLGQCAGDGAGGDDGTSGQQA